MTCQCCSARAHRSLRSALRSARPSRKWGLAASPSERRRCKSYFSLRGLILRKMSSVAGSLPCARSSGAKPLLSRCERSWKALLTGDRHAACQSSLVRKKNRQRVTIGAFHKALRAFENEILKPLDFAKVTPTEDVILASASFIHQYSLNATDPCCYVSARSLSPKSVGLAIHSLLSLPTSACS